MEVFDKDIEFIKDIFADDDKREVLKRTIAICLASANPGITLGDIQRLSDALDELLLPTENSHIPKEKSMTI